VQVRKVYGAEKGNFKGNTRLSGRAWQVMTRFSWNSIWSNKGEGEDATARFYMTCIGAVEKMIYTPLAIDSSFVSV